MRALLLLALLLTLVLGQRLVAPEEVARAQVIQKALPAVVRVQGSALSPEGRTWWARASSWGRAGWSPTTT